MLWLKVVTGLQPFSSQSTFTRTWKPLQRLPASGFLLYSTPSLHSPVPHSDRQDTQPEAAFGREGFILAYSFEGMFHHGERREHGGSSSRKESQCWAWSWTPSPQSPALAAAFLQQGSTSQRPHNFPKLPLAGNHIFKPMSLWGTFHLNHHIHRHHMDVCEASL